MAKTDGLDVSPLVKLSQIDFLSESEKNAAEASDDNAEQSEQKDSGNGSKASKAAAAAKDNGGFPDMNKATAKGGKAKSPFTAPVKREEPSSKSINSIFGDILCCKMPSFSSRKKTYGKAFLRDLKLANLTLDLCKDYKKNNPQDAGLNVGAMLNKNKNLLSPNTEDRWNALVKSELLRNTTVMGLSANSIFRCVQKASGRSGAKYSNKLPLTARNKLKKMLNQDPCKAAIARDIGLSSFLSRSTGNALLDILLDGDPTQARFYTDLAMTTTGLKGTLLGGIAEGIATGIDIRNRFMLLDRANPKGQDLAYIKTDSSLVMGKLPEDDKSSGITFDELENGLDKIDPNWEDKNDTIKSEAMQGIVNDKLNSIINKDIELTGDYVTKVERVHKIAIINKFTENKQLTA